MKEYLSEESLELIELMYEKICIKVKSESERIGDKIPYISKKGKYLDDKSESNIFWWTNGFWCGILWQMYNATQDESYMDIAKRIEKKLAESFKGYTGLDHDLGFLFLHSSVADFRLTGDKESYINGKHAANLLAGRYNPNGKFIRAWNDWGKENNAGWIIIDCMMNLPLLYWAGKDQNDPRFKAIAINHADTAMEKLVRPDGSCNHIACLDPETGDVLSLPGGQGFTESSSWTRGQAWALYGFALSYENTGKVEYLDTAKRIAHYFIANAANNDFKVLIDFRAPSEPVLYDSSAAACAVSGLLEIAKHCAEYEKGLYINSAFKLLKAVNDNFCDWNPNTDGILGYGSVAYSSSEQHISLIYADYFFIEAVLKFLDKDFMIW